MKLFNTKSGIIVLHDEKYYLLPDSWDILVNRDFLFDHLVKTLSSFTVHHDSSAHIRNELLAPIGHQEVWAAGVTYHRSREARMEESKTSGASAFYEAVYGAERPELFFKASAQRVVGHGDIVHIRRDSSWSVPEPELTLFINSNGIIQGYTVGNDMSSRSIEGENPLYLPQAKTFERCAALGPCLYVPQGPISPETTIAMEIVRRGKVFYSDAVPISRMKRQHTELAAYLFRESDFPNGCFLMTGTGLVPPDDFTLQVNDVINIRIEGIGLLSNKVGIKT
jgi:2-dehydro-3-deoxy-D-arabinonate dehydratase